jgi:hypothetical protein
MGHSMVLTCVHRKQADSTWGAPPHPHTTMSVYSCMQACLSVGKECHAYCIQPLKDGSSKQHSEAAAVERLFKPPGKPPRHQSNTYPHPHSFTAPLNMLR